MGVLFPSTVNAPHEGRGQGEDPEHDEDGAEQRNQVVSFGALCLVNPYTSDGFDDGAVPILLAHQVNDLNRNVFNRTRVRRVLVCGDANVNLVAS